MRLHLLRQFADPGLHVQPVRFAAFAEDRCKKGGRQEAEDATKAKLASALEKAREEAEKAKSVIPDGAAGAVSPTATETKATDEKPVVPGRAAVDKALLEKPAFKLEDARRGGDHRARRQTSAGQEGRARSKASPER